jgi:hypothetical protein
MHVPSVFSAREIEVEVEKTPFVFDINENQYFQQSPPFSLISKLVNYDTPPI